MLHHEGLQGQLWRDVISQYFRPREDDGHEVSLINGRRLIIQTSSLENEPGQIVLMTDQTETRDLQAKLARHQRLMAMGKMVASLAHQVRTPLSGAMLYSQHLASSDLDADTRIKFSKKLGRQLKNIEAQVRDMLIFARGSAPLNKLLKQDDLIKLICEAKNILHKQFQAQIEISSEYSDCKIQCHQESLIGAIQNLISNGIEAAEECTSQAKIRVHITQQKNFLTISVCDNGPGLKASESDKMTEPFYTTKSNGTGLGLPVVNAVVRAHYGKLTFFNHEQGGACFVMSLPISHQAVNKEMSRESI